AVTAQLPGRLHAQDSLPGGFGSLKRDDIAVHFSTGQLDVQVLPLKEWIIRLLAPDTYRSLSDLIRSRQAAIDEIAMRNGVSRPTLIQVTFSGLVPQARFSPEELNIASG